MKRSILMGAISFALMLFTVPMGFVHADPITVTAQGIFKAATVGTSSTLVVRAGAANTYLAFYNPSAAGGNTVYCQENAPAVANAAGTIGVAPGQYFTMESSMVDGGAWNCIAAASTPFTYGAK